MLKIVKCIKNIPKQNKQTKQSKAKQSKAKQSKTKQNKQWPNAIADEYLDVPSVQILSIQFALTN